MGSTTTASEEGTKQTKGCCPCWCKSDCKANAPMGNIEFHFEGSIPDDVEEVPVIVKKGNRLHQATIKRNPNGGLKCSAKK